MNPPSGPNVLFVFADQLSMEALNIYGNRNKVETPNIDYLSRRGVTFTNSYCSTPQCSPSRSSILTGLYPHKTEVVGNVGTVNSKNLDPNLLNIGTYLKSKGYRTGYFGKWHLGTPIEQFGFDFYQVYERGNDSKVTQDALEFMNIQNDMPWFSMVSYDNPHDIYFIREAMKKYKFHTEKIALPTNFKDDLKTKPTAHRMFRDEDQGEPLNSFTNDDWKKYCAYYYYLVESIDYELGILLGKLRMDEEFENTIIIFTSDHGDLMGAHGIPFKGPMMYEELIKVPFVISCPSLLPSGETRDCLTVNVDLFPTLCDLLQLEIPEKLDGLTMKSCLLNCRFRNREHVVIQYYSKQKWINPIRTVLNGDYKYNLYLNGEEELYNLNNENGETGNLSRNPVFNKIKSKLKMELLSWIERENDPFFYLSCTNRQGVKMEPS